MAELVARDVTLDICPTSNVQADDFDTLADVPLRQLIDAGVPVTLSTDDRTVSDLTLVVEYQRAMSSCECSGFFSTNSTLNRSACGFSATPSTSAV